MNEKKNRGFTLIELLVVIAIIGLLSSIVLASLGNVRTNAQRTRTIAEMQQIINAVGLAKSSTRSLINITGSNCSRCSSCTGNLKGSTGACYTRWVTSLTNIQTGTGNVINISRFNRDMWGSPFLLDENEGESGGCNTDRIRSAGPDGIYGNADDIGDLIIPNTTSACI